MSQPAIRADHPTNKKAYLSSWGAWALAFGCAVGWGAFVMPGTTFLPIAGPLGTTIGIGLGALAMLLLAANFHFLMERYPDGGGTYTYTKRCYGYDHGFISAWFLILTYVAIIWANATALPLIVRTLFGGLFQFGFHYQIAGYHVYMGEILLAVLSLGIGAWICLNRRLSQRVQVTMALGLMIGIVLCFAAALFHHAEGVQLFDPPYSQQHTDLGGAFTIFALAPWAFVGFESISHSAPESKYPAKRNFRILALAVLTAAAAYILLTLLAVTALPEGCASWTDYVAHLDQYSGLASQPAFFAADAALGGAGKIALGLAALCAIFTGLIGNYIALSRLLCALSKDGLLGGWIGKLDKNDTPRNAILCILAVSVVLPFLGRTAISWIVDVTTVGATIAYAWHDRLRALRPGIFDPQPHQRQDPVHRILPDPGGLGHPGLRGLPRDHAPGQRKKDGPLHRGLGHPAGPDRLYLQRMGEPDHPERHEEIRHRHPGLLHGPPAGGRGGSGFHRHASHHGLYGG